MSEEYIIKVKTPGKKLFFRNRVVRTPVELRLTKNELSIFKVRANSGGITDFSIELISEKDIIKPNENPTDTFEDPQIEELEGPKSTLQQILNE